MHIKQENPLFAVYGLIDPRNSRVFYVGQTINVKNRMMNHRSDPGSAAFGVCRDIIRAGFALRHVTYALVGDIVTAMRVERMVIKALPYIVNHSRPLQIHRSDRRHPLTDEDFQMQLDALRVASSMLMPPLGEHSKL